MTTTIRRIHFYETDNPFVRVYAATQKLLHIDTKVERRSFDSGDFHELANFPKSTDLASSEVCRAVSKLVNRSAIDSVVVFWSHIEIKLGYAFFWEDVHDLIIDYLVEGVFSGEEVSVASGSEILVSTIKECEE